MNTEATNTLSAITGAELTRRVATIRNEVSKAFLGQQEVLDQLLLALLAGGHVLIEGVPGLGKTLLVRALATVMDCQFAPCAIHARSDAERCQRPCFL